MAMHDPSELRYSAERFRKMAEDGDDPHLKVALIELADDFEREAAALERWPDSAIKDLNR